MFKCVLKIPIQKLCMVCMPWKVRRGLVMMGISDSRTETSWESLR